MKNEIEVVALTQIEKKQLYQTNLNSILTGSAAWLLIAPAMYFILPNLDRDMSFITYVVVGVSLLALGSMIHGIDTAMQDLRVGTKKVFQDVIIEKKHRVTQSTTKSGNATHHDCSFSLGRQGSLSVSEAQYSQFTQSQIIQVEQLSVSGTLWNLLLVSASGEITEPINATIINKVETKFVPFDNKETVYLQKTLKQKTAWRIVYAISFVALFYGFIWAMNSFFSVGFYNYSLPALYVLYLAQYQCFTRKM